MLYLTFFFVYKPMMEVCFVSRFKAWYMFVLRGYVIF